MTPTNESKIKSLKDDLISKIEAEGIHGQNYIGLINQKEKNYDHRGVFQKGSRFSKTFHKPKSINLNLNWDSRKLLHYAGNNTVSARSPSPDPYMRKDVFLKKIKNQGRNREK